MYLRYGLQDNEGRESCGRSKRSSRRDLMKLIPLTRGKFTIVDDECFELLNKFNWHIDSHGYAARNGYVRGRRTKILMHRVLLNIPKHLAVDHINGDRADNRKCNLRICDNRENQGNRRKRQHASSAYKGVSWHSSSQKWQVRISDNKKRTHVGVYNSETEAALAYNNVAVKVFGEFALLNVIESTT
jgi:hypothetical protein